MSLIPEGVRSTAKASFNSLACAAGSIRPVRGAFNHAFRDWTRVARGPDYQCPWCSYEGSFALILNTGGLRRQSTCPCCGAAERHRLQRAALDRVTALLPDRPAILHVAPESLVEAELRSLGDDYRSADLYRDDVDVVLDLTSMSAISSESIDLVWASHVLEHIEDDGAALREICRILRFGGIAVLPVPIVADETVEYSESCPAEHFHVRAPGLDYFDRYRPVFGKVEVLESSEAPPQWQPWIWEDRSGFPTRSIPERPAQAGRRHSDYVPICVKTARPQGSGQ